MKIVIGGGVFDEVAEGEVEFPDGLFGTVGGFKGESCADVGFAIAAPGFGEWRVFDIGLDDCGHLLELE